MPTTRRRAIAAALAVAFGWHTPRSRWCGSIASRCPRGTTRSSSRPIRGYAHLGAPTVDVKGPGFNQLGDHFSPILVLIAPFYRVFPSAQTILIAQAVLIAISVAVIAALAMRTARHGRRHRDRRGVRPVVRDPVGGGGRLPRGGVRRAAAGPRRRRVRRPALRRGGLWSLPLLLVKEDFGVTVAAIGVVLWLAGERRRGLVLAAAGLVAAALTVLVIMPAFAPGSAYAHSVSSAAIAASWRP